MAAFGARVQALEMARTFVPYQASPVKIGTGYSKVPIYAISSYTPGRRSRKAANNEPSVVAPSQIILPAKHAAVPA